MVGVRCDGGRLWRRRCQGDADIDQVVGDNADGGFIRHSLQLRFGIAAQVRIVMAPPMPRRSHAITSVWSELNRVQVGVRVAT